MSPVVPIKRRTPSPDSTISDLIVIDCPYCGKEHTHGTLKSVKEPGLRRPHCYGLESRRPDYRIVASGSTIEGELR